ncbi:MAG: transcriptional regulator [Gammaproteobacteria bacterium]|nr:transcriptional regulator [Gammaproteobacteria bacterium]
MTMALQRVMDEWQDLAPVLSLPKTETEYEQLLEAVDSLMQLVADEPEHPLQSLLDVLVRNIEEYEEARYPTPVVSPEEVLRFFMQQHNLKQSDLPEIGSQGVVSEILNPEKPRKLTLGHINELSERFGVSPAAFVS